MTYEKVTDIFTSQRQQMLIHLTPGNSSQLSVTEGHADKCSMLQQAIYKPNQPLVGIKSAHIAINSGVIHVSIT
ncbi:MAG: hypothetical protein HC765_15180 [Brachymonas sp.]|nr:hypothetical protein [Brachymonas sp.]